VIACTHPGKIGDALYALPTVRALCQIHGCKADFYTSEYCRPILDLVQAQPYIRHAIVAGDYIPERADCGVQPWQMPVPDGYDAVHHLGFRTIPDRPLNEFIASQSGIDWRGCDVRYDFYQRATLGSGSYTVLAARGETSYADLFREVIGLSPIPVVEIGAFGEYIGRGRSLDLTGLDMLEILPWLADSGGFFGLSSAMLVLANGFSMPKVVPHDGRSWDERHWVQSPYNHYLVNPSAIDILYSLGINARQPIIYSKTYDPADNFEESAIVLNINEQLASVAHRFEHPLRAWEYGLALNVLRSRECFSVLDVGGGGSVFAPAAASLGITVVQVDPGDCLEWVAHQAWTLGRPLVYHQQDIMSYDDRRTYDAVTCLSVLEHIEEDRDFFRRLQSFVRPGGLLILTVDFWPDGVPQVSGHLRTYNVARLSRLINDAPGFELLGTPDYTDRGAHVHGYTFASLVLKKVQA